MNFDFEIPEVVYSHADFPLGRVFDKDGVLKSWWSDVDDKKYREKARCMIDQYSSYVVPGTGNMTV